MMNKTNIVPIERIESRILLIREKKVMIDRDLAELYGVTTKRLNQAVTRNRERFPDDFIFKLNRKEKKEVVTNCDHLPDVLRRLTLRLVRRIRATGIQKLYEK